MESPTPNADDLAQDELWASEAKVALRQSTAVGVADAWGDDRRSPSARSASLLPETFAAGPLRGRFGRKGRRPQPRQPEPQPEPDDLDLGPEVHGGHRLDLDMEPFEAAAAPEAPALSAPEPPAAPAPEPVLASEASPSPAAAFRDPLDDLVEPAPPVTALSPAPLAPLPLETSSVPAGSAVEAPAEPAGPTAPAAESPAAPALTGWDTLFDSFDPPSADPLGGPVSSSAPASAPAATEQLPTVPLARPASDAASDPEPDPATAPTMPPIWGKHPDEQSPEKPPVIDPW